MGEEVAKTTVGTRGVRVEYCYGRGKEEKRKREEREKV